MYTDIVVFWHLTLCNCVHSFFWKGAIYLPT